MSVLQTLRNRAGLLISIFIGFALLAFILTDLLNSGKSMFSGPERNIAVVDGEEVDVQVYYDLVNQLEENYQNQSGKPVDQKTRPNILRQAWDELLNQVILDKQYDEVGLGVRVPEQGNIIGITAEEMKDIVIGKNIDPQVQQIFRNPETGQFDKNLAVNFLKNMESDPERKAIWLSIEKGLMQNRVRTKYNTLLSKGGAYVTNFAAEQQAAQKNKKYNIQYVALKYSEIADSSISVSESELSQYFNENKSDFEQVATRDLEYIAFNIRPSREDFAATEKWVSNLVEEFKTTDDDLLFVKSNSDEPVDFKFYKQGELNARVDTFAFNAVEGDVIGPYFENGAYKISKLTKVAELADSVRARHILVKSQNAVQVADSLKALIQDGADFATLAIANSEDPGSGQKGGDLGWFKEGTMVKPFNDTCFFGEVGKLYTVYSQFGVHLVEVLEKGDAVKKVQVSTLSSTVEPSTATRNAIYSQAGIFASKVSNQASFNSEVEAQKLSKRIASNIKSSDHVIAGLESPRMMIKWAYQSELNTTSEVFECGDKFVVACLTNIKEEGVPSLESVKEEVELKVIAQKKAKILTEKINAAAAGDINTLAQKINTKVGVANDVNFTQYSISGLGVEPRVLGFVTTLEAGQMSSAIEGTAGVYVVSVVNVKDDTTATTESEKQYLQRTTQSQLGYAASKVLKDIADVEDNRIIFE